MNFIKLFDVEFDDKYDDVIVFTTKQAQSSYFSSRFVAEFEHDDLSVIKELSNVRVYGNYNKLHTVNYAYFENEIDGVTRGYYAFVTSVGWAGIDVVSINLKIDVFQTYMFEHKLAPSYVRRAHVHQYDQQNKPIRKYLYTPENVDYGDEYITIESQHVDNVTFTDSTGFANSFKDNIAWLIAVGIEPIKDSTNQQITLQSGNIGFNDGFYYLALPVLITEDNDTNYNRVLQLGKKRATAMSLQQAMSALSSSTQIISLYLCRSFPFALSVDVSRTSNYPMPPQYSITFTIPERNARNLSSGVITTHEYNNTTYGFFVPHLTKGDLNLIKSLTYGTISKEYDIKSQCFPYKYFSITNDRANEVIIKPQYLTGEVIQDDPTTIYQFKIACNITMSVGVYAKQGVYISDYLGNTPTLRQVVDTAVGQLPQKTDRYLNFLQTQKASFDAGLNAIYENAVISAAGNLASVGTNLLAGNYAGAASGAGGLATSVISTAQKIELQQARIQDIKNTPDSLKKSGTDIKYEQISGFWGIYITTYQIPSDAMQRVSDYFTLYGYTITDFIKDFDTFLDTRKAYNYVQTMACRVTGKINVQHIQTLEAIYDHGVRLWHYDPYNWTGFDFNKDNGDYYGTSRTPQIIQ